MDVDAINNAEVYSGQNSSVLETKVQEFTVQCPSYKFKEWDVMCAKPTFKSVPQTISRDALSQKKSIDEAPKIKCLARPHQHQWVALDSAWSHSIAKKINLGVVRSFESIAKFWLSEKKRMLHINVWSSVFIVFLTQEQLFVFRMTGGTFVFRMTGGWDLQHMFPTRHLQGFRRGWPV